MATIEQVVSEGRAARCAGIWANPYSLLQGDSSELVEAWHQGWMELTA